MDSGSTVAPLEIIDKIFADNLDTAYTCAPVNKRAAAALESMYAETAAGLSLDFATISRFHCNFIHICKLPGNTVYAAFKSRFSLLNLLGIYDIRGLIECKQVPVANAPADMPDLELRAGLYTDSDASSIDSDDFTEVEATIGSGWSSFEGSFEDWLHSPYDGPPPLDMSDIVNKYVDVIPGVYFGMDISQIETYLVGERDFELCFPDIPAKHRRAVYFAWIRAAQVPLEILQHIL